MKDIRAVWETEDKVTACRLEYWIKQLSRKQKLNLIESPETISSVLPNQEEVSISIVKIGMDQITRIDE